MAQYVSPIRARLPDVGAVNFGDAEHTRAYMQSLVQALTVALERRPTISTSQPSQLFLSPNGSSYEMTVDDAGAPVFTLLKGPKPDLPP